MQRRFGLRTFRLKDVLSAFNCLFTKILGLPRPLFLFNFRYFHNSITNSRVGIKFLKEHRFEPVGEG